MSDREYLPEFIRDALAADEGSITPPGVEGGEASSAPERLVHSESALGVSESELRRLERTLGALLEVAWPEGATSAAALGSPVAAGTAEDFAPSAAVFERLEATLREPPHRYAPFFARAAELFDLPEATIVDELRRLQHPKVWRFAGLPGIHNVEVSGGPRVKSAETLFVRFAPGTRFPKHRHTGLERVLVLEGSYRDSTGVVHRAGELREWPEGTEHGFVVDVGQPCIFASVVFGRRFSAWPLRALASVLGR